MAMARKSASAKQRVARTTTEYVRIAAKQDMLQHCARQGAGTRSCTPLTNEGTIDCTAVSPKYSSRLVVCGNLETAEGPRRNSPAADLDSRSVLSSWCAESQVFIRLVISPAARGGVSGEQVLASRVPIHDAKDVRSEGLLLRLKETCQASGFPLNHILPTSVLKR